MEKRRKKVLNKSNSGGRTVTADYGHVSAYRILRLDDRYSIMGVVEIWKKVLRQGKERG